MLARGRLRLAGDRPVAARCRPVQKLQFDCLSNVEVSMSRRVPPHRPARSILRTSLACRRFGRRTILVFGLAIAMLSGCSGSGGTAPSRIIILTNVPDPFWDTCEAGANAAAKDLKLDAAGLRVTVEQNTKGVQGQINRLREWAGDPTIAAVAVSVTEPDNTSLVDAMRALRDRGVKVTTIDSDVNRDEESFREVRYGYIGTDNVAAGRELGKAARGLLPEGGKFATFVGVKSQANAVERDRGFKEGAGASFEQTDFLADADDGSKARQNVRDAIARASDVKLLVGLWAYNPPAIADVVAEQKRDDMTVIGFDAAPLALSAMEEGRIKALLVQDPYEMGYLSVKLLAGLVANDPQASNDVFPNYGDPDGDVHLTGLKIVVPSNSPLSKDLFDEGTEFLSVDEFRTWLAKYNLSGS
jgi:ribose transport system substrate-binding protein